MAAVDGRAPEPAFPLGFGTQPVDFGAARAGDAEMTGRPERRVVPIGRLDQYDYEGPRVIRQPGNTDPGITGLQVLEPRVGFSGNNQ